MTVSAALAAQNARLPASRARDAHLQALAAGAPAVVTGQQVGLFLGPLFTLYKAATAIRLARELDAVPVFWLQTEDHDTVEIASVGLPGKDGQPVTVQVPASAENRVSIAHLALPDEINGCLTALAGELGGHVHAEAHLARLARHYRPGVAYATAFAGVLAELFAPEGLVVLDPRDRALAEAARPVHARALQEHRRVAAALEERSRVLGERAQVHVRPGAPLSYVHPDGPEGPRFRLDPLPDGGGFELVQGGRALSAAAVSELVAADPRCLSSSALLRPVVQDTILRTAAYVGGPAEVAYYAQIEPLFPLFDLPPPRVVRRSSFRLVPAGVRAKLERLGLATTDLARGEDELLAHGQPALDLAGQLLAPFSAALAGLDVSASNELPVAAARAHRQVARSVERFARKVERAILHRDQARVAELRRARLIIHPEAPQERIYGMSWFAARMGDRELAQRVLAAVDLRDPGFKDIDIP